MRTGQEYRESLRKQKPNVYILGEKVESVVDHPMIKAAVNATAGTFEMAEDPRIHDLMTVKSPLIGKDINIWTNIDQNAQHVISRQRSLRIGIPRYQCFYRCMSLCALNPLWAITWECDQEHKTEYHHRLVEYVKHVQGNDLMVGGALTDARGDRSLTPSQQPDPDAYVRVLEKKRDGIVVNGAKLNITAAPVCNEIVFMPHRALTREEKDYAVAFALPIDTKGITIIPRPCGHRGTREYDYPVSREYGQAESSIFLDHVFVPWERVFMCGESDMVMRLVLTNPRVERQLVSGCAAGKTDLRIGAAALIAEYNGTDRVSHVAEKLLDMVQVAEMINALGISSAVEGEMHPSGVFVPAASQAHLIKYYGATMSGKLNEICMDIGGGLVGSVPTEADYKNPATRPLIDKYLKAKASVPAENRYRAIKLLEDLTMTEFAGWSLIMDVLGGGSPAAARVGLRRSFDWESRKRTARIMAGIEKKYEGLGMNAKGWGEGPSK